VPSVHLGSKALRMNDDGQHSVDGRTGRNLGREALIRSRDGIDLRVSASQAGQRPVQA